MSAYVSNLLRRKVRDQFGDRCAYCQTSEHLTATRFEIEHIVPRADGGQTILENLCLACPMCNRFKADRTSATDPATGAVALLFHPNLQAWIDHFSWNDDATEIVGRTAVGRATVDALRMNRPAMLRVRRLWVAMGEHPPATPA